jgi:ABC-type Fe3+ transport system substrate-binding protein
MEPWEEEFETVLEAARSEGSVVIAMGGSASRNFGPLFDAFQDEYPGITVVRDSGRGSLQVEKYSTEIAAGQFTGDLWMTGVTSADDARKAGITDAFPMDYLIRPDVADPSNWLDGHFWFADPERNGTMAFCASPSSQFAYNTELVDPATLDSYWDLVDGRFQGKIVGTLPWEPGQTNSEFYINNPELGEDFIRKVLDPATDVTWVTDGQQGVDLLVEGAMSIMMYQGNSNQDIDALEEQGLPVKNHFGQGFAEGGVVSVGGTCSRSVFKQPAHPNATKVFLNWWLRQETLHEAQGVTNDQSLRADIEPDNMNPDYIRPDSYFSPEMLDNIDQEAGLKFNRQLADEFGLR